MIVAIPRLLPAELVATINREMDAAPHTSGNAAPGVRLESVKRTRSWTPAPKARAPQRGGACGVARASQFPADHFAQGDGAVPFSRYQPGMFYGDHNDQAVMGRTTKIRTDMSVTIFLSDPASYDGGELVLDTDTSPRPFKRIPAMR